MRKIFCTFFFRFECELVCERKRERDRESVVFGFTGGEEGGFVAGYPVPEESVLKSVFNNR